MKAILNDGTEIECTPKELLELKAAGLLGKQVFKETIKAPEKKKEAIQFDFEKKTVKFEEHKRRKGSINWTALEDKIIKEFYTNRRTSKKLRGKEYENLCNLLEGKRKSQISERAFHLGLTGNAPHKNDKVIKEDKRKSSNVERFTFMNQRANSYMKKMGWNREQAYAQSATDWKNGRKGLSTTTKIYQKTTNESVGFPIFPKLTESGQNLLESIVRNVIGIKGTITYKEICYVGLKENSWNVSLWKDFVEEFISRSNVISKSFNVDNKFVAETASNGYLSIKYE